MRTLIAITPYLLPLATLAIVSTPSVAAPVLEWQESYDGGGLDLDVATAATTDSDGNLVIAGQSSDGIRGIDMLVRKLDRETGDPIWSRRISAEGAEENNLAVGGIVSDGAGNFLVGGTREGCYG
ncbi:hypothetical protein ACFL6M_03500 [Candidatus Eisenbacteria bacterium]|uniref:Uncharacterized protein n=1 Tax=Eiseniibacteriota bacterium TaxID=2212470 RepID=A0ABV6YJY2_UNCEI